MQYFFSVLMNGKLLGNEMLMWLKHFFTTVSAGKALNMPKNLLKLFSRLSRFLTNEIQGS